MEDLRMKARMQELLNIRVADPKKRREEFMVQLRKQRKNQIFNSKRKLTVLVSEGVDGSSGWKPDEEMKVCDGTNEIVYTTNDMIELFNEFWNSIDEWTVLESADKLWHIVSNSWDSSYTDFYLNEATIKRYRVVMSLDNKIIKKIMIKLLANLFYEISSIKPVLMVKIIEGGLLQMIVDSLSLPLNLAECDQNTCSMVLVWLINMWGVEPVFKAELLNLQIIKMILSLLANKMIFSENDLQDKAYQLLACVISKVTDKYLEDLALIIPHMNEEFLKSKNMENTKTLLTWYSYCFKISEELCTSKEVVTQIASLVSHTYKDIQYLTLEWIWAITCFQNLEYMEWCKPISRYQRFIRSYPETMKPIKNANKMSISSYNRNSYIKLALSIICNLVLTFSEGLATTIVQSKILEKIFLELGTKK